MRNVFKMMKKSVAGALVAALVLGAAEPSNGWAMLAPVDASQGAQEYAQTRAQDMKTVQTALESEQIRQRLAEFKLTPEQIDERLSQLTQEEIHQTAQNIEAVAPGGDVAGVLVIVILVLLVIYLFRRV